MFISDGYFQIPVCTDQSNLNLIDTHGIGKELFTMEVPTPSDLFSGEAFTGLQFSIENSTLDVATINSTTGW